MRRILAWSVHLFTASGAVLGAWALLAVGRGEWRVALLLMMGALFVDAVDGMLARAARVADVVPGFDGRRLDDMVDYLNYVVVPVVFLVAAGHLPHPALAAFPILASAYGFGQVEAKTPDDFFLGFPSYWNVVALYAWWLDVPPWLCTGVVLLLSLLVFVPFKYVYPSRLRAWRGTTAALLALAGVAVVTALAWPDLGRRWHLVELSLLFPAWYLALSWRLGGLAGASR